MTADLNSSLSQWLTYMHSIHVSAIDMGLQRVLPVFDKLAIEKKNAWVFTVAGTNGKGSTTATIAQICQQAGYKTALYQSPHLLVFNERIKINGDMVQDDVLIQAFFQVEQARLACGLTLSFFEMTTLAALLIFAQNDCDVWVLEVGLGGRLDVVNVIEPDLAVITNVGIDHVDWLGHSREQIAIEKAGILRENLTLVYGESDLPNSILPIIQQKHVKLCQLGRDYQYLVNEGHTWYYSNAAHTLALPMPNLSVQNTATAITAILASRLNITLEHIQKALPKVHLAGRFDKRQILQRTWIFDVAHNAHGMQFLVQQLLPAWQNHKIRYPDAKLHLIFSMLADKNMDETLQILQSMAFSQVYGGVIDFFRASSQEKLQTIMPQYFPQACILENLSLACDTLIKNSQDNDMILVCGSFHTIFDVLNYLQLEK